MTAWLCAMGAILVIAATDADAGGNAATGAALFNRCALCHATTKDGGNRMGPDLFGVVGRKAGTYPGFAYSTALKASGIVWTPATLDAWLEAPQKVVPGNTMPLAGVSSPSQRADLVAYLATLK